jgi:hypothetical protein
MRRVGHVLLVGAAMLSAGFSQATPDATLQAQLRRVFPGATARRQLDLPPSDN